MKHRHWLDLQLFAGEGTGEGGGEGAATGENAAVDAEQRLRDLGVPEDKLRRRANRFAGKAPAASVTTETAEQTPQTEVKDAASESPTEENAAPSRMSWDDIMKDPEYNREMQKIVRVRLSTARAAEENLAKLTPALEILARKHGMDVSNLDYDALAKAVSNDNSYYEERALEMGVPVETAKKIDQQERDTERAQKTEARNLEQQRIRDHFAILEAQGKEMKKIFPSFDLQKELQNPVFVRMTSPGGGISVEDAYYAIHRKEIQESAMKATAENTARQVSNAVMAGSMRPVENGISRQASSVTGFDYSKASKSEREAFKKELRERWARGEKVYPSRK